jgi:hypothetical protein
MIGKTGDVPYFIPYVLPFYTANFMAIPDLKSFGNYPVKQ